MFNLSYTTTVINFLCTIAAITGILIIAIDRVGSQIATTIEFINDDRLATFFYNIYSNGACDGTTGIVAAEYFLECTVCDVKRNICIHIGILGTSKDKGHILDTV